MRTLIPATHMLETAKTMSLCTIPTSMLQNDHGRLFRVDLFFTHGQKMDLQKTDLLRLKRFVTNLLHDSLMTGVLQCDHAGANIRSSGTYDGMAVEISDIDQIPLLPHAFLYHIVFTKQTDLVLKLAVVGPTYFHPVTVSNNIAINNDTNRARNSAIFTGTLANCP